MTSQTKIDESARRRADFIPGAVVTLADGQQWHFRKPVIRFTPDDSTECGFQVRLALPGDGRFADLMKRREGVFKSEGLIGDLAGIELAIARLMLAANYDMDGVDLGDLLQFGYHDDDPEGAEMRLNVMRVAEGLGPKSNAGGGESPPTPAED